MPDASLANIEALHEQPEWLPVTLSRIGHAGIHHRHQRLRCLPKSGGPVLDWFDTVGRSTNTAAHCVGLRLYDACDAVNAVADLRILVAGRG